MKGTEERISELEDKIVEISQSEKQRKKGFKKMIKSTLENCGTMKRVLTFMPLETGQK